MLGNAKNIVDVVRARSSSDALAYVFLADGTSASEQRWTFADTARRSRAFAAHLADRGIHAGSRVVLATNPGLDYIAALFGIMLLGAIPVPCFPPLRTKELDRFHAITVDCSPDGIVIDAMYSQQIDALHDLLTPFDLDPTVTYAEDVGADARDVDAVSPAAEDLALIQYTSGSTGSPKGVCLTHDNLVSNCQALDRSMGHDPDRVGLSWLPPYHDMGLMGTIVLSMYHGWPLVLMSPMHFVQQPRRWFKAITDYRVSITVGPNFSLDLCADSAGDEEFENLDLSSVKELYCGAEPISVATLDRFQGDQCAARVRRALADPLLWDGGGDAVRVGQACRIPVPRRHLHRRSMGTAVRSSAAAKSTASTLSGLSTPPAAGPCPTEPSVRSGCRGEAWLPATSTGLSSPERCSTPDSPAMSAATCALVISVSSSPVSCT